MIHLPRIAHSVPMRRPPVFGGFATGIAEQQRTAEGMTLPDVADFLGTLSRVLFNEEGPRGLIRGWSKPHGVVRKAGLRRV